MKLRIILIYTNINYIYYLFKNKYKLSLAKKIKSKQLTKKKNTLWEAILKV